jgi:hypothetical protein
MIASLRSLVFFAGALSFVLAGVADAQPRVSWMAPAATLTGKALLYASGLGAVDVYAPYGKDVLPVGQLSTASGVLNPGGVATDLQGNLWIADAGYPAGGTNEVMEFARGRLRPAFVLHQAPLVVPTYVAVDRNGTVFVGDYDYGGNYYVSEFLKGRYRPFVTLGPFFLMGGLTLDGDGDLYLSSTVLTGTVVTGRILEFTPGQTHGNDLGITIAGLPGGLAMTDAGSLLVVNATERTVATYAPNRTQPSRTITVPAPEPFAIATGPHGDNIFVGAGGAMNGASAIFQIDYGSGHVVKNITAGFPNSAGPGGLAVSPFAPSTR